MQIPSPPFAPSAISVQIKGPRLPSQPAGSGLPKENKSNAGRLPTKHGLVSIAEMRKKQTASWMPAMEYGFLDN